MHLGDQISAMAEQMMVEQQQKAATRLHLAAQKAQADIAKTQQMTDYYEAATGAKLRPDTDTRAITSTELKQSVIQDLQPVLSKARRGEELTDAEKNRLVAANLIFPATGGETETPIEKMFGGADVYSKLTQGVNLPGTPLAVDTNVLNTAVKIDSKEGKKLIKDLKKSKKNKDFSEEQIIEAAINKGYLLPEE
jgi:hypothetical protein